MCTIPAYTSYQMRWLISFVRVYKTHIESMYRFYIFRPVNVVTILK
jgi:hypothetical protein